MTNKNLQAKEKENTPKIAALEDRVCSDNISQQLQASERLLHLNVQEGQTEDGDECRQAVIRGGNPTAHGGGAIVGTRLYEGAGGKCDKEAYVELYGLGPLSVLTTSEPPTAPHTHRKATPVVQALIGLERCCVEQPRLHRFFG